MKVVYIGGGELDKDVTISNFYKNNFKIGDVFEVDKFEGDRFRINLKPNIPLYLSTKYFSTLEEWREMRINQILE